MFCAFTRPKYQVSVSMSNRSVHSVFPWRKYKWPTAQEETLPSCVLPWSESYQLDKLQKQASVVDIMLTSPCTCKLRFTGKYIIVLYLLKPLSLSTKNIDCGTF